MQHRIVKSILLDKYRGNANFELFYKIFSTKEYNIYDHLTECSSLNVNYAFSSECLSVLFDLQKKCQLLIDHWHGILVCIHVIWRNEGKKS